jgi:hypothetical protein
MKNISILLWIVVAGRAAIGCSDDGVYEPREPPADETGQGGGVVACSLKEGCDAGAD